MTASLFSVVPQYLAFDNPFAKFGVTGWEPLVANAIAFFLAAVILKVFAFGPIQKMLEERKQRIIEGEKMRAESEHKLKEIEHTTRETLSKANEEGNKLIQEAREAAQALLEQKQKDAIRQVEEILEKSRESAALEAQLARTELRAEFARLIAQTTAQVAGKVLTDEDRRRIDMETINSIK